MSNEYIFFTDQTALTFRICLVYFLNFYMFLAYLSPLSVGTNLCITHLVLIILIR